MRSVSVGASIVLVLLSISTASAGHITTIDVTVTEDDLFAYEYLLTNGGEDSIFDFTLIDLGPVVLGSITAPDLDSDLSTIEWDFDAGPGFIDWFSTDPSFDIAPGASLDGFSYESKFGPTTVTFLTVGADPDTGEPTDVEIGSTIGAAPEPSSLVLLGTGIVGLLAYGRRRLTQFPAAP